eukprot:3722399-Amphidinium_carterae.1
MMLRLMISSVDERIIVTCTLRFLRTSSGHRSSDTSKAHRIRTGSTSFALPSMRSASFVVQGMRSTSSPLIGLGAYADIDGCVVCVREIVKVCATSVDAYPKQLPRHQSWQPSGETTTERVQAGLWREHPHIRKHLGGVQQALDKRLLSLRANFLPINSLRNYSFESKLFADSEGVTQTFFVEKQQWKT